MSFKINSNLAESQIESDVASYLGLITPFWSNRYRLFSIDERAYGADKLFNRFVPIYLQFKVSQGLKRNTIIPSRFLNSPLPRIIHFRKENELSGNPILYFKLRKKANNADDLQHNILRKFHNPPYQYGLYIAPLTLYIDEYEKLMEINWYNRFIPLPPYEWKNLDFFDEGLNRRLTFERNPFLRAHISIPPHLDADSDKHYYSYSKNGSDVAWHGGTILSGDFRLSNQFYNILSTTYSSNFDIATSWNDYKEYIRDFNVDENNSYRDKYNEQNGINSIVRFSYYLKQTYNIHLMFLAD